MYCNSCGHNNPSAAVYCSNCGERLAGHYHFGPQPMRSPSSRKGLVGIALGFTGIAVVALGAFIFENVGYIPFRNDSMAPATIEVGAAETVLTLQPKEERPLFFWLFHNHQRYFATSISYPDGYRYNQHFSLLITPGPTQTFRLEDAPAPQLSLQNESMGRPYFQVVELPSGPVTDDSVAKAIQSGQATDYNDATVVRLEYGKTYAVTADATYSATENHVAKGVFSPEPGFTYKMLTCGETGAYGQNCGPFQIKNQDGGWYDASAPTSP